jgi:hypothetical protein
MATTILTHDQVDVDSVSSSPKSTRRKVLRHTAIGLVAALLTLLGLSLTAPSASAATTDYGVSMNQACKYTYNNPSLFADYGNYWNPFSWYCVSWSLTVSLPPSWTYTPVGGVDVQKYCSITYPGSRAVVVAWNAYGWRCRR